MARKSFTEQLIEVIVNLPDDEKEFVAVHLLGTVQGMKLEQAMQKEKESA